MLDPQLPCAWLSARSIGRGLPLPVFDHGGWRVETGLPDELRRHVFAGAGQAITSQPAPSGSRIYSSIHQDMRHG